MKALLTIFIALTCCQLVLSQDWKPSSAVDLQNALAKCSDLYRSENYSLTFSMTLYKNIGSTDATTTKGSLIRGKGKQYRSEQPGKLIIQTEQVKLLVDSSQQVVGIMHPDTLFDAVQIDQLLKTTAWEELTIMTHTTSTEKCFRTTGNSLSVYTSIEFRIDLKTGHLKGMTMDLRPYNYFSDLPSDETVETPRVVVSYSIPRKLTGDQLQLLDVSSWITKKGDRYELTAEHQTCRLEDYRLPIHH